MIKFLKEEWCILSIITTLWVCAIITDGMVSISYILIQILIVSNYLRDLQINTNKVIDARHQGVQTAIDYIKKEINNSKLH